ncbi:MAG: Ribose-5-phosphate isomerase [Pseudomonadota bacterium]|jgi:ribose 5-phosphate isomerase A
MTSQSEQLKIAAARASLAHITPDSIIGIGSGSTVNCLIRLLPDLGFKLKGAVAASTASERLLHEVGVPVIDLSQVDRLSLYIDGADEIDHALNLIKGGGAALTREKIIAANSDEFICIADHSKYVPVLGKFPLPIEIISMAKHSIMQLMQSLGGKPVQRPGLITDNGHPIIDVHDLAIAEPFVLEQMLNNTPGVVTNGIFAMHKPKLAYLASPSGVRTVSPAI